MFGINYIKAGPTTYVIQMKGGRIVREGLGLAFYAYTPTSTISFVPAGSIDVPFAFEDTSADFQTLTVQGQLTYRVADAKRTAALLDFSVDSYGRYVSDDPQKLSERIVNAAQVASAAMVHREKLRDLLAAQNAMVTEITTALQQSSTLQMLGVELLSVSILAIRPSPETAKALEADAREQLLRQADEAIYARRNAAVEQERRIKESELNTELAVEEKQRQIQQKKMEALIQNETQRAELISSQVENDRKAADARAYAAEAMLKPLRATDWRVLMAANASTMDPKVGVALAIREIAENASKIGEFNLSPELMANLIKK